MSETTNGKPEREHDVTLDESYRLGRAAGYADGWDEATRIANAQWERRLRDFANGSTVVSQLIAGQTAALADSLARLRNRDGLTVADLWPGEGR